MRLLKGIAVVVVAMVAIRCIDRLVWQPYRCDVAKKRAQRVLISIFDLPRNPAVIIKARSTNAEISRCLAVSPTDADMYMTVAGLDRVIGRFDHAEEMYRLALRVDQRPELYLNLGLLQLENGDRPGAFQNLVKACLFNLDFVNEIANLDDRAAVHEALAAHRRQSASVR